MPDGPVVVVLASVEVVVEAGIEVDVVVGTDVVDSTSDDVVDAGRVVGVAVDVTSPASLGLHATATRTRVTIGRRIKDKLTKRRCLS